jgi:hypothetical protein
MIVFPLFGRPQGGQASETLICYIRGGMMDAAAVFPFPQAFGGKPAFLSAGAADAAPQAVSALILSQGVFQHP